MAQFESFLEKKMKEKDPIKAYEDYVNKGLGNDAPPYAMPYTKEDMADMFEDRMKGTTYEERTAHYFEDQNYMLAKAKRYIAISENAQTGENELKRPYNTDEFSRVYDNKSGKKRRGHAKDAALHFAKAWKEQVKLENARKAGHVQNNYELYKSREKIMKERLDGMLCAAEAKSKGSTHEQYMKLRAKLSCYTILLDQVVNLRSKTTGSQSNLYPQFDAKERELRNKIKSVQASIASNIPSVKDQWQSWIDMKGQAERYRSKVKGMSRDTAEVAVCLNHCLQMTGKRTYPCAVPLKDSKGAPITRGEEKKEMWNREYQNALKEKDTEKAYRLELDALKRFEEYKVPELRDLQRKGTVPCFMENPGVFLEAVYFAAPYYQEKIKKDGWLKDYAMDNPKFAAKVNLLSEMRRNFVMELQGTHHLRIDGNEKGVKVSRPEKGVDYRTQTLRAKFADLHRAYDHAAEPSMDSRNVDDLIQMHDTEERLDDEDDFDYEKLNTAIMDIDMGKEEEGDLFDLGEEKETNKSKGKEKKKEKENKNRNKIIIEEEIDTNNNIIINENVIHEEKKEEEKGPDHTELIEAFDDLFLELPKKIVYINPNWQKREEKDQKITLVPKKPRNLNKALELRKEIHSNVLEDDIVASPEINALNEYYDKCVKEFLKTETPVFSEDLMQKKTDKWLNLDELAQIRNEFTKDGLFYEELPEKAKEIYDYYSTRMRVLEEMEAKTGVVKPHDQRKSVHHTAFLQTNLKENYEQQVRGSLDCWSCAGSGILNHFTRGEKGHKIVKQEDLRGFEPKFRNADSMKLKLPKDQAFYDRMKEELEEFTTKNQSKDRTQSVMGNPYMVADFYLKELSNYDNLKNTAVRRAEFNTSSARKSLKDDPSVLHNMAEKFKSVVHDAIKKDSALTLLCGMHYVTIIGIDGDQLTVCDSNNSAVIDNTTYKVSDLFSEHAGTFAVELTWLESIEDPNAVAEQYTNLKYDPNTGKYESEGMNQTECIGLCEGVEAWKSFTNKEEDIRQFYSEGIYLPKKFETGVHKKPVQALTKNIYRKDDDQDLIIENVNQGKSKKKETTDKSKSGKETDKEVRPETKETTKKDTKKTAKSETIVFDVDMNKDMEDVIGVNPDQYLTPEHAAEFKELQKTNPNLTLDGYRYYRNFKISQEVWEDPKLNTLLTDQVKAVANIKETGFTKKKNAALSLAPSALLLDVRRKNDGTVPAEYRENVKWNEKWIKSWAIGKEEDRKKLVDEMLPQVIREVEIPNPVELRSGWIERQMDQNYVTFTGSIRRMLAMDHLMEEMPQAFKSLTPYLKTRLEAARQMAAYVKNYMLLNYGFSPLEGRDGCRMKAPLKAKQQRTLETQSNNLIEGAYQQAYNQYTEQEIAYLTMLKESGYIETKAKLQAVGKKLHKKRQEELRKTPEYLQMQAYEKEEYKREKEAYEREQSQKKAQRENDLKWANAKQEAPKASEAQIQKFFEIEKILDEVKKDKEKQGKDKKPQKEIALPTMEQIKNGWVDDMFQNHTRELIELLQNGSSEMDEKQALAYEDLVNLIVVGISARHGVKFSTNGEKCTMGNPDHSKGMKSFIDKVLSKQYSEAYCELKGLDKKETWADFTAEKKKENKAAGKKDEKKADEKKKEDKKEINENKIIEKEDNSDSGDEFFEEEKKEQKKKTKEQVKIDLSRPLTKEEKEEFDRLNQGMKLSNERFVVFQAIKDSDAFMKYKCMTTTTNYMVKHTDICLKRDNLGLLGALSPLIQSIPKEETRATSAVQHNEKWTKDFCGAKRNNAKCMESMNQMITEHFPKVFDGFVLPTPDELRAGWLPRNIKNNSFRLFEVLRKAAGVPKLVEESDTAREIYEKTPGFKQKAEAFLKLNEYAMKYIEVNYGIKRQNHREVPEFGEVRKGAALANANDDLDQFITQEYSKAYGALTNQQIEDMNGTKWDFSNCRDTELKLDDE